MLYSDLRKYLAVSVKLDMTSEQREKVQIHKQRELLAIQIYKDYLLEGADFEIGRNQVTEQLLRFWDHG